MTFTMKTHESKAPKHSTRFEMDTVEAVVDAQGKPYVSPPFDTSHFKPSFYFPKPVAERAKRIRVTIEEL